jgi:hypothetical protein
MFSLKKDGGEVGTRKDAVPSTICRFLKTTSVCGLSLAVPLAPEVSTSVYVSMGDSPSVP